MNKKLETLIEKFLSEKRKSDSGYAPVTVDDVNNLYKIIDMLVEAKFEPDADGDYPVDYEITDLTRYERSHFVQIPHWLYRKHSDENNDEEVLNKYAINLSIATERLKIFSDILYHKRMVKDGVWKN